MARLHVDDEDTLPTQDPAMLAELRMAGLLGPLLVSQWFGSSTMGSVRAVNEDRWGHVESDLFVVADGMGGREGGEFAAQAVVDASCRHGRIESSAHADELVADVNEHVVEAGRLHGVHALGSTMVSLSFGDGRLLLISIGDSRVYRRRNNELELLTRDQNVRSDLLDAGVALATLQSSSLRLDALTSYLGRADGEPATAGVTTFSLQPGDRFLACTDGVHGQLRSSDINAALSSGSCEDAVMRLLESADRAGGRDNATAVVIDISLGGGGC